MGASHDNFRPMNMKSLRLALLLLIVLIRTGFAQPFDLSSVRVPQHKVDDYIRAAVALQAMGREVACQTLFAATKTNSIIDYRFDVLCRMLFTHRGTNAFRPPFRGTCSYYLGQAVDWPLDPIEIVDGIPFFIRVGCRGQGGTGPQSGESYLRYCMTNCDWNTYTFREVTAQQKSDALTKLLASEKARPTVTDAAKKFLEAQIE
jgi:hypothetical protein